MDTVKANAKECFNLDFQHLKSCTKMLRSLGALPLFPGLALFTTVPSSETPHPQRQDW